MVKELVAGVHQFRSQAFRVHQALFEELAHGQNPGTLFITCSDSRIDPNLLTNAKPGSLFVLRNAGNIVPAYSGDAGGEIASIEFAVAGLKVSDIVVCGHSHCGAMKGLLHPEALTEMPAVADWLKHSEATRRIVRSKYKGFHGKDLLDVCTEENVLVQVENLQTHPAVAVALAEGKLSLHAWLYEIETGVVYSYDPAVSQFLPLNDGPPESTGRLRTAMIDMGDARWEITD